MKFNHATFFNAIENAPTIWKWPFNNLRLQSMDAPFFLAR